MQEAGSSPPGGRSGSPQRLRLAKPGGYMRSASPQKVVDAASRSFKAISRLRRKQDATKVSLSSVTSSNTDTTMETSGGDEEGSPDNVPVWRKYLMSLPDGTNVVRLEDKLAPHLAAAPDRATDSQPRGRRSSFLQLDDFSSWGMEASQKALLRGSCQKWLHGWSSTPIALQELIVAGFTARHTRCAKGDKLLKEGDHVPRVYVVTGGTFEATSTVIGEGTVAKAYVKGDALCIGALYDESGKGVLSHATVTCVTNSGTATHLDGNLFRRIMAKRDTLNENIDTLTFLRNTGYFDDVWNLEAEAERFIDHTFTTADDLISELSSYEEASGPDVAEAPASQPSSPSVVFKRLLRRSKTLPMGNLGSPMKSALKGSPTADEHSVLERANGSPMSHSQSFRFANEKDSFNSRYSTPENSVHDNSSFIGSGSNYGSPSIANKQRNTFSFNVRRASFSLEGGGGPSGRLEPSGRAESSLIGEEDDEDDSLNDQRFACIIKSGRISLSLAADELMPSFETGNRPLRSSATTFDFKPGDCVTSTALHALLTDSHTRITFNTKRLTLLMYPASRSYRLPIGLRRDMDKAYLCKLLGAIPVFRAELTDLELSRVIEGATHVTFPAGAKVYREGEVSPRVLYLIYSGAASVVTDSLRARRMSRRASFDATQFLTDGMKDLVAAQNALRTMEGVSANSSPNGLKAVARGLSPEFARPKTPERERRRSREPSTTTLQDLHVGDYFGGEAFSSTSRTDLQYMPGHTVVARSKLRCLAIDAQACGPLLARLLFIISREHNSWLWAIANRNPINFNSLTVLRTIGQGAFGTVKLTVHLGAVEGSGSRVVAARGKQSMMVTAYALKVVPRKKLQRPHLVLQMRRERELLEFCKHPFILRCAGAYQNASFCYLLLDLELGGELWTVMREHKKLTLEWARFYMACVVAALVYMASVKVAYRDLKPENLLIDSRGYVKIADLGCARIVDGHCFTFCGTIEYMAPEVITGEPHDFMVDWWSLGILLYEMLLGATPFNMHNAPKHFSDSGEGTYASILAFATQGPKAVVPLPPCCFPTTAAQMIRALLMVEPSSRLKPSEAMAQPFFEGISFIDLERKELEAPFVPDLATQFADETDRETGLRKSFYSSIQSDSSEEDAYDFNGNRKCEEAWSDIPGFTDCPDEQGSFSSMA